jgi:acyl carrier protein
MSARDITRHIESLLHTATPDTAAATLETLDSLRLVELILKLEDFYAIRLTAADIDAITTIDSLAALVQRHRAPKPVPKTPAPAHAAATLTLACAEMRGPQTRLTGTIQARAPAIITLTGPTGTPYLQQPIAIGTYGFDLLCPVDLATQNLALCQVTVTPDGAPPVTTPLPPPERTCIPDLHDGGANRRHLTAALPDSLTKPTPLELLQDFDTLGDNCEFGVLAGQFGSTEKSLFSAGGTSEWMTIPRTGQPDLPAALSRALANFAEPADLRLEYIFGEWMIFSQLYDFCFHTGQKSPHARPLAAAQSQRLMALKRKLLTNLANPAKIFIRKSNGRETPEDLAALLAAMRRLGDAWLLAIVPADAENPPGSVTMLPNKMLRAAITAQTDYRRADRIHTLAWLTTLSAVHLALAVLKKD